MLTEDASNSRAIGIFDSGVGGLSVWREIVTRLPEESTLYLADQAHVPYGDRPPEEIVRLTVAAVSWLLQQRVKLIVIACNTASAAALESLRSRWPAIPIIGMEPAIKPASQRTRTGHVGVLATPGTLRAERFQHLVERYANGVHVHTVMGTGLVHFVEQRQLEGPEVESCLRGILAPLHAANIDHLVLGCTHFPFLSATIRRVLGDGVKLVDPAPAIARRTQFILEQHQLQKKRAGPGAWRFVTTGDLAHFQKTVQQLVTNHLENNDRPVHFQRVQI